MTLGCPRCGTLLTGEHTPECDWESRIKRVTPKMSALVLFSGGLDSTVALFQARQVCDQTNNALFALAFNYGQRHITELGSAVRIARTAGALFENVWIPTQLFPDRHSSLLVGTKFDAVRKYDAIPSPDEAKEDPAFIPHRNLLFLAIAGGYARHWRCQTIYTGLRGGYPDCSEYFEDLVTDTLRASDPEFPIKVVSPCHGSREETIGLAYSLPGCWDALAYSTTCFEGTEPPCGRCLPCLKRAEGFAKFGKPDPLLVRLVEEGRLPRCY